MNNTLAEAIKQREAAYKRLCIALEYGTLREYMDALRHYKTACDTARILSINLQFP